MKQDDVFVKLHFRESQLEALKSIYKKYFLPKISANYKYEGKAIVFVWDKQSQWETSKGFDVNHNNPGYSVPECKDDILWQEFKDLLPYMGTSASVSKMPPETEMKPHVDRKWRPEAIYFPIEGCTEKCVSFYYKNEHQNTINSQSTTKNLQPVYKYAVSDSAFLTNVHEWHGVKNYSNLERTAFGWNFKDSSMSFQDCKTILKSLNYIE